MSQISNNYLREYLKPNSKLQLSENNILKADVSSMSEGMKANIFFFSHKKWAQIYFMHENTSKTIGERWETIVGSWDNKTIVDLGCGPGNLFRSVKGKPKTLIGVDISEGSLLNAKRLGYIPLLADTQNLPLISNFADIVMANATLHHVDDVEKQLSEAARLVKSGGMLITDEDPIAFDHKFTVAGRIYQFLRLLLSLFPHILIKNDPMLGTVYNSPMRNYYRKKTELHQRFYGDGVNKETYFKILEPLGFTVKLFPHTHAVGKKIFDGDQGEHSVGVKIHQRLNNLDSESFCSIMCVAVKNKQALPHQ